MTRLRQFLIEYWSLVYPVRRELPWIIFLMFVATGLELAGLGLVVPFLLISIDQLPPPEMLGAIAPAVEWIRGLGLWLGPIVVLAYVAKGLLGFLLQREISGFAERFRARLMLQLMTAHLAQPTLAAVRKSIGTTQAEILNLTNIVANGVFAPSLRFVADGALALILLGVLILADPLMLSPLIAALALTMLVLATQMRKLLSRINQEVFQSNMGIYMTVTEGVACFKEIRLLRLSRRLIESLAAFAHTLARTSARAAALATIPKFAVEIVLVLFLVGLCLGGIALGRSSESLLATLALFGAAGIRLAPAATALSGAISSVWGGRQALGQLHGLATKALASLHTGQLAPPAEFECLDLADVHFAYARGNDVLAGVNVSLKRGQTVGILGRSGAGKSTLAELMLGLIEPTAGEVQVNGAPLLPEVWAQNVGYVPQHSFLVEGSIAHNVAYGVQANEIDQSRLWNALGQAQLAEFVSGLAERENTQIGERGLRLSGGQRQRIALARTLYFDRHFIVLDEATAALDHETEREIIEALRGLSGQKTLILIAHRLSTLRICDRLLLVAGGQVRNIGNVQQFIDEQERAQVVASMVQ